MDDFKLVAEKRNKIAALIKAAQPDISNRKIAKALGVDERTVRRDTAASAAPADQKTEQYQQATAANAAPASSVEALSGSEIAALAERDIAKRRKEIERAQKREKYASRTHEGGTVEDLEDLIASGKRFAAIYADPPWTFEVYSGKGKERSAERHYDTMSLDDICALPISCLMAFNDVDELGERLAKDLRIYCEGTLTADAWIDREGKARPSLNIMRWRCIETNRIGRNKPKRDPEKDSGTYYSPRSAPANRLPASSGAPWDDDIGQL